MTWNVQAVPNHPGNLFLHAFRNSLKNQIFHEVLRNWPFWLFHLTFKSEIEPISPSCLTTFNRLSSYRRQTYKTWKKSSNMPHHGSVSARPKRANLDMWTYNFKRIFQNFLIKFNQIYIVLVLYELEV